MKLSFSGVCLYVVCERLTYHYAIDNIVFWKFDTKFEYIDY